MSITTGCVSMRCSRDNHYDDVLIDTFTPPTCEVELLQRALQRNTIACVNNDFSRIFMGLTVVREMSQSVRIPFHDGGKRTIYLADSDENALLVCKTLSNHLDLTVGLGRTHQDVSAWPKEQWSSVLVTYNVLVMTPYVLLKYLQDGIILLNTINLLVLDNCHMAVGDHPYVQIMPYVDACGGNAPLLFCLTSSLMGEEVTDPEELASRLKKLESTLNSVAETFLLVISEQFGCYPKETVIECEHDSDVAGIGHQLGDILCRAWDFLEDCRFNPGSHMHKSDPLHVPKFAISECLNILQTLGPWCASSIADNLISQLEKVMKHETNLMQRLFIRYAITELRMVIHVFEVHFNPNYDVEELLNFTTAKVKQLVNILRQYKPDMDFKIVTKEDGYDDVPSDFSDDNDDDDEFLDMSDSDDDEHGERLPQHLHIAVTDAGNDTVNNMFEVRKLAGLVVVENRYIAFALNKVLDEICAWDENLCFLKSSYVTVHGSIRRHEAKDDGSINHRQEEVFRRFRLGECNLLLSTSMMDQGMDIPKCNLVVQFDPPMDYRSYAFSKGCARAKVSQYMILVGAELMEDFSDDLKVFRGIEEVLNGRGRTRQHLRDVESVDQSLQQDNILPTFTPPVPGSASVSMKTAISVINRYCAKLPSDSFTHLSLQCRVSPAAENPGQFVAYLRLPVNSPVKDELQGPMMPNRRLAEKAVALKMCEKLYAIGELDSKLQPVGKEIFLYREEEAELLEEGEEQEGMAKNLPGTIKHKQYYTKKQAEVLINNHVHPHTASYLYRICMVLTGPITEDQNTRGRKVYDPEKTSQSFGFMLASQIPTVPCFPVYTRSGEVTVMLELQQTVTLTQEQLEQLIFYHHFVFTSVLHLDKEPMVFDYYSSRLGLLLVPLTTSNGSSMLDVDWMFLEEVHAWSVNPKSNDSGNKGKAFDFDWKRFEDAVVMPSYRNVDQPQHFYVAEIRADLSPLSEFPSPELYKTFAAYYTTKYGLQLSSHDQPMLDVDHTSARLNLLTPRYMNQKGCVLPTSSLRTRRTRRENLQQKQILIPELCDVHVFSASLWRKAVCLPAILHRISYLLIAEELRRLIAFETKIGKVDFGLDHKFPRLHFGFETNPSKVQAGCEASHGGEQLIAAAGSESRCCDVTVTGLLTDQCKDIILTRSSNTASSNSGVCFSSGGLPKTSSDSDSSVIVNKTDAVSMVISRQLNEDQQDEGRLRCFCSSAPHSISSVEQNCMYETKCYLSHCRCSLGGLHCKISTLDVSDEFLTPPSSVFGSPESSDSGHSHYEEATASLFENSSASICNDDSIGNTTSNNFGFYSHDTLSSCGNHKGTGCLHNGWCGDYKCVRKDRDSCSQSGTVVVGNDHLMSCGVSCNVNNCQHAVLFTDILFDIRKLALQADSGNSAFISSGTMAPLMSEHTMNVEELDEVCIRAGELTASAVKVCGSTESTVEGDSSQSVLSQDSCLSAGGVANSLASRTSSEHMEPGCYGCGHTDIYPTSAPELNYLSAHSSRLQYAHCDKVLTVQSVTNRCVAKGSDERIGAEDTFEACRQGVTDVYVGKWGDNSDVNTIPVCPYEQTEQVHAAPEPSSQLSLDEDVDVDAVIGPGPCDLLHVVTMSNANDFFNLERLETIGDSFLKYAITVYLYCSYPCTHEGKLSYLRSKQVSNYNLYRLGKKKGLGEYMVSSKFEPFENWLPPGYIISEGHRRGPVPRIILANSVTVPVLHDRANFTRWVHSVTGSEPQTEIGAFNAEVDKISHQHRMEQQLDDEDVGGGSQRHQATVPYTLQLHHSVSDKSVADCVEALIGCYLTTCGKWAALTLMSWLGLKVLPPMVQGNHCSRETISHIWIPKGPLFSENDPKSAFLMNSLSEDFSSFESSVQYIFQDKSYLLQAFTHASYCFNTLTDCYQRLEFLGDAVLDYVITRHLYEDARRYSPGILTDLRSALVNNNIFAALAVKWNYHKFFKALSLSLFVVVDEYVQRQKDCDNRIDDFDEELDVDEDGAVPGGGTLPPNGENGPSLDNEGTGEDDIELEIPKAMGDIFESVAGAIYLDSGMSLDVVWRVYYRMMRNHIDKCIKDIPKSPVRKLLEAEPETAKFEKPERTIEGKIRVTVKVVGRGSFCGTGRNYRIAKSAAAKKALRFIDSIRED